MRKFYMLDEDHNIVVTNDIYEWEKSLDYENRRIAEDFVMGVRISTVFLGIDHGWDEHGPPILFETMVFGGNLDGEIDRYPTYKESKQGHADMLRRVRAEEGQ